MKILTSLGQVSAELAMLALLIGFLAALLLIQLFVNAPGEAVEDGLSTWAPDIHLCNLDRVPSSWLQLDRQFWPFGE